MDNHDIPFAIQTIFSEKISKPIEKSNLNFWQGVWSDYTEIVKKEAPYVDVEENGASMFLGDQSPGCLACKNGKWDCIFVTPKCNLQCSFCFSPFSATQEDQLCSALGDNLISILGNYEMVSIRGIGFSGGEPFIHFERLLNTVISVKKTFPENYLWIYTNGLMIKPEQLYTLCDAGINELRFNIAASNYNNNHVLKTIELAATLFPHITIEIPMIPNHEQIILDAVSSWADIGVKHLNIHELVFEPGTPSETFSGDRAKLINVDGHVAYFNPISRYSTLRVMEKIYNDGIALSVNDCSVFYKLKQVVLRRKQLAKLLLSDPGSNEEFLLDTYYVTIIAYNPMKNDSFFIHPRNFQKGNGQDGYIYFKAYRLAPLTLSEEKKWVKIERCCDNQWLVNSQMSTDV